MPHALAIGVPYELFWHLTPVKLKAFSEAYRIRQKMRDEEMWIQGRYIMGAFEVVMAHFGAGLSGKTSDVEYYPEPFMQMKNEYEGLTQEEIDNIELQKMLFAEEQWIRNSRKNGLNETEIK